MVYPTAIARSDAALVIHTISDLIVSLDYSRRFGMPGEAPVTIAAGTPTRSPRLVSDPV